MDYFSADYSTARERFCAAAAGTATWSSRLDIPGAGPQGEPLTVDIAWLGERSASQLLLHTSGLHGVEGFAGSAIQLGLLAEPPKLAADCALVLVHILNPYGMAWLRRVNSENVDLNRNFIFSGSRRQGASEAYTLLNPLLNPRYPPRPDLFYLQASSALLRFGYRQLKAAIACGQSTFPRGLFYGGDRLQPEVLAYRRWLQKNLQQPKRLLVVDVHTGLGRAGQESLFHELCATPTADLNRRLDCRLTTAKQRNKVLGYEVLGGHQELFRDRRPGVTADFITQEFGSRPALAVLRALRAENQWHHYGTGSCEHPSKLALQRAFTLSSAGWRQQIEQQGISLVQSGLEMLAGGSKDTQ